MTSDKRTFINTPPVLNNSRFDIWKVEFRMFLQSIKYGLWETIINGMFIPARQVNDKVVDKPNPFWIKKEKRNFKIDF